MTELREGLARAMCAEQWQALGGSDKLWRDYLDTADAAIAYLWPLAMEHAAKLAQNFKGLPNEMLVAAIRSQEPPK